MPHHDRMAAGDLRSLDGQLSVDRRCTPCRRGNARLPRQQQLQPDHHGLLSCHLKDFRTRRTRTTSPAAFPDLPALPHDLGLAAATFDHSKSGFPLTGAHTVPPRQCADCHINNNYNLTITACIQVPPERLQRRDNPVPHTGFPTTCEQCHDTIQWTDGKFDHTHDRIPADRIAHRSAARTAPTAISTTTTT